MVRVNALTIVDHLHVVTRTSLTDPVTAGLAADLRSGSLEDRLNVGPRGRGTAGHERRAITGTFLTTRDTGANEEKTLRLELLGAADRIGIVGVTTIDDDISRLEMGNELLDELVNGRTGFDEEDDLAGTLELGYELLDRPGALDLGAYGA